MLELIKISLLYFYIKFQASHVHQHLQFGRKRLANIFENTNQSKHVFFETNVVDV